MSAPSTSDPEVTGVGEPSGLRWKRRAVSVPAMLLITAVAFTVAPILALGLVTADLVVGRIRLPRLRLFGVALQYLFNDTVEILFAPVLWVVAGFGYDARGVIMAEMLSDPGFDLLYGRLGSVFINRDRGQQAQLAIRGLGEGLDDRSVAVTCPEGRLWPSGECRGRRSLTIPTVRSSGWTRNGCAWTAG